MQNLRNKKQLNFLRTFRVWNFVETATFFNCFFNGPYTAYLIAANNVTYLLWRYIIWRNANIYYNSHFESLIIRFRFYDTWKSILLIYRTKLLAQQYIMRVYIVYCLSPNPIFYKPNKIRIIATIKSRVLSRIISKKLSITQQTITEKKNIVKIRTNFHLKIFNAKIWVWHPRLRITY